MLGLFDGKTAKGPFVTLHVYVDVSIRALRWSWLDTHGGIFWNWGEVTYYAPLGWCLLKLRWRIFRMKSLYGLSSVPAREMAARPVEVSNEEFPSRGRNFQLLLHKWHQRDRDNSQANVKLGTWTKFSLKGQQRSVSFFLGSTRSNKFTINVVLELYEVAVFISPGGHRTTAYLTEKPG